VAHRLDWLAVFVLAFEVGGAAIDGLLRLPPPDGQALATAFFAAHTDFLERLALVAGLFLVMLLLALLLTLAPAWVVLRLLLVGRYRLVKAGCLLLCAIGLFVVTRTGLPFVPLFEVVLLVLFLTTFEWQAT
jgi:hypothetical protein